MPDRVGPHIGELNRRITLVKPVVAGGKQTWSDWASLWASFEQQTGLEAAMAASNPTNIVTSLIKIRYIKGVQPKMRVRYLNRYLEIMSVIDPDENHRELHLVVKEATS